MRFKIFLGTVLLGLMVMSCGENQHEGKGESITQDSSTVEAPITKPAPTFQVKQFSASQKVDCGQLKECVSVDLSVVVLEEDGYTASEKINEQLYSFKHFQDRVSADSLFIISHADSAKALLGQVVDNYVAHSKNEVAEEQRFAENPTRRSWEESYLLLMADDSLVSVTQSFNEYTGGAHGYFGVNHFNFDRKTGEQIPFENIVLDTSAFLHLCEANVRSQLQITGEASLQDQGLFSNTLPLTKNIGLSLNGMEVYYGLYELGPYAMGAVEFTIPYDSLEGVLNPKILGNVLKDVEQ